MSGLVTAVPVRGGAGWAWLVIGAGLVGGVVVMGASTPDAQMFMALTAIIAVLGVLLIPRMARRDGLISARFLGFALTAHIVGSLLRFIIIQAVYHGVADANGYYGAGVQLAPLFRSLQFPAFPNPGTAFMNFCTGLLFAITGPTMLGGFVVCAALGFVGSWFFYKAFRISFPDGDARLFSLLIFLLPSMWYWPSSLGKDGLIVLFLGIATYGFALILRGRVLHGFWVTAWGIGGTVMIRPPMAAALVVAAAAAVLLRPARVRSIQAQALLYMVLVPVLVVMSAVTIQSARTYIHSDDPVAAFEAQQTQTFGAQGGGSNFAASSPFTPKGLPIAIVTVNFRPFPYEAGGLLPAIASLEGVVLLWLAFRRRHEVIAGLRTWHSNGMVILAFLAWFSFSVILSSLPNFGLLARQRTQALPYLFMLLAMVPRPTHRLSKRGAAAAKDDPELVAASA